MIESLKKYEKFLKDNGVGKNDKVADSIKSYVSYLNSVSKHLNITISTETLGSENDIRNLSRELEGKVAPKTVRNYVSAMKQYVNMK